MTETPKATVTLAMDDWRRIDTALLEEVLSHGDEGDGETLRRLREELNTGEIPHD